MTTQQQKQRGVFSEVLDPTLPGEYNIRNVDNGPTQELYMTTVTKQTIPKAISLQRLQTSQASRGIMRQDLSSSQFNRSLLKTRGQVVTQNVQTVEPKVVLPYDPIPGEVPRKVAIDRRRKEFKSLNFEELLNQHGINFKVQDPQAEWLKLEYFDDTTFDDNSNEDWLRREYDEVGDRHPLIGRALKQGKFMPIRVTGYLKDKDMFTGVFQDSKDEEQVHRLFLCFDAEDPRKFARRLANAYQQRIYSDALIRYNHLIDNMSLLDLTELDNEQKKRIEQVAKTKKIEAMDATQLLIEVNCDFQRTMNKIIFDTFLENEEESEHPMLRLPPKTAEREVPMQGWMELEQNKGVMEKWMYKYDEVFICKPKSFHELQRSFVFSTLYVSTEVVFALSDIRHHCNQVLKEHMFDCTRLEAALHMDEYKHMQENATTQLMYFLKGTWIPNMIKIIKERFSEIGKGWFNMKETSKITYDFGKLKRLLTVIRLMMQDTITTLVKNNFDQYEEGIRTNIPNKVDILQTNKVVNYYEDGQTADSTVPVFNHNRKIPIFQIELLAKDDHFHFTTNPQLYVNIVTHAIKKGLDEISKIPDLEPRILADLYKSSKLETFIKVPMMPIQEPVEPDPNERPRKYADDNKWVWDVYYRMKATIEAALEPLNRYKEVFNQFLPVLMLKPDDYARELELEDPPKEFEQLREEIQQSLKKEKQLAQQIPLSVHVGIFEIHLNEAKGILEEKYQTLQKNLIDLIARRARSTSIRLSQEIGDIKKTILKDPLNIEDLTTLKEYLNNLPGEMEKMKVRMTGLFDVFKMLEEFNYRFPVEDFQRRWKIFGSPKEIREMVEVRNGQLEKMKVKFAEDAKTLQLDFKEQVDNLERTIQGFHHHQDMNKHKDTAEIVEYVMKQISEFQEQAQKYNYQEALFDKEQTDYSKIGYMVRDFKPYYELWTSAHKFKEGVKGWLQDDFNQVDAEEAERIVEDGIRNIQQTIRYMSDRQIVGVLKIAESVKKELDEFKPKVPLLLALRKKGMTKRHWEQVSVAMGSAEVINPDEPAFTFNDILKMNMMDNIDKITQIGETAGKEYQIETMLDNMLAMWDNIKFQCVVYKNTHILKGFDEIQVVLDEHIINTQAMVFSPFKKHFQTRIEEWDKTLKKISDVLEEWAKFQQQWMYLQPIFDSQDIAKQLPVETKKFKTVDQTWRTNVSQARVRETVKDVCIEDGLFERLHEANKTLELIQKELNNYLEKKREKFARFYFLSNDELLEILSQTKEPTAVQPHLKKVFENIHSIEFDKDKKIHAMFSAEKERVSFVRFVDPNKKSVEDWMNEVENMMRLSVRQALLRSIELYTQTPRREWVLVHPGQCVLNGSQVHWTKEVEEAITTNNLPAYYEFLAAQQNELVDLVRTKLSKQAMVTINALIVIDVHARDVIQKVVDANVNDLFAFEWISQLRYYWQNQTGDDDCWVKCVQTNFPYGYEYLGNTLRLVITPLTDKCYMTLMGALRLNLGGAPAGPAGTGKTESTKDLAKALAKQCVVFNCSDQMDFIMVGKFFKGLASAGAWACFDEFNRINIEVLSVIAQQLLVLFGEKAKGTPQVEFEGSIIKLQPTFSVFITMNPGYAGRTELPDNLKALFRPMAMMVPDYAMIGEIMLYSFGFKLGRNLAKKMVATFKLSSEQLSSQDHYDYGMRAVRSVINAAGLLKVATPDMNEEQLLLRALRDVCVPKFLKDDLPLFENIISDLFPGLERPVYDYGKLVGEVVAMTEKHILKEQPHPVQPVQPFIDKVLQLYDTIQVRHGLMLVGPTGGGKTTNYQVLAKAITRLGEANGYYKVHTHVLNPKSITMGQLYGCFNEQTHEWTDGVLAYMVREAVKDQSSDRHWIMFDGPVDALWIESMNTVLDDNKKLCLNSGQILTLTQYMTMMFEVEDLAVASPATVSRCGMVYLEPRAMGVEPLQDSYFQRFPTNIKTKRKEVFTQLQKWFNLYVNPALDFLRKNCKEIIQTQNNNLVQSMHRILDSLLSPYVETEIRRVQPDELEQLSQLIEQYFHFSLIWSIMATVDFDGRIMFDKFHRQQMLLNKAGFEYPQGLIYDFMGNLSPWSDTYASFEIDPKLQYHEIVIPTTDSVRNMYIMKLLLTNNFHVLCPGPTGTGKSQNVYQLLVQGMPEDFQYISITFSAQTSANQTQDNIDSWIDKRRKGVRGPPVGKRQVVFVDDLNMPKKEEYGAQPPIELLRQILDHQGWYNRQDLTFVKLEGMVLLGAMGPPGGGRSQITARIVRHFNVLAYTELDESVIKSIFSKMVNFQFRKFTEVVQALLPQIIKSVLSIYNKVRADLLPTPSKSHYTFNLRDIYKVFQGMCGISSKNCQETVHLVRLWYHENMRVFHDRLINEQDRTYFKELLASYFEEFGLTTELVIEQERIIFCDFLGNRDNDIRPYIHVQGELGTFVSQMEELLEQYNKDVGSKKQMKLVMFLDACEHITRISRVLRQPYGNALLLGIGGSGRQSLSRLATYLCNYKLQSIEVIKNYNMRSWREDVKKILMLAGVENKSVSFVFVDTQIINEQMLEDINNILNSGDVTNLYNDKDAEDITQACKAECVKKGLAPNKMNIFTVYLSRVKKNMHIVIAMSPIGDAFLTRLRMFPSLVNCCTIDWFTEWPEEALEGVGKGQLMEVADKLEINVKTGRIVDMCKFMHKSVERLSQSYKDELRRINYVTPTSYLELLSLYITIVTDKRVELKAQVQRLKNGLDKLQAANSAVDDMKIVLQTMQPELELANIETNKMMENLKIEKDDAAITQKQVAKEETEATMQAAEANEIAVEAAERVKVANEQLAITLLKVKELQKDHLVELKSLASPPEAVKVVLAGVVILNTDNIKAAGGEIIMQNIPGVIGKKEENYFDTARKYLLGDANALLKLLMEYPRDNIKPEWIAKMDAKVVSQPKFNERDATLGSKATGYLYGWCKCMYDYYKVFTETKPLREKLEMMNKVVQEKGEELRVKKEALAVINAKIDMLQRTFEEKQKFSEDLQKKIKECEVKLERAQKLTEGLSDEKERWSRDVKTLEDSKELIAGNALIAAGMVAYSGSFVSNYRQKMESDWRHTLQEYGILFSEGMSMRKFLGDEVKIQQWNINGLPKDDTSIENGIIIDKSRRWSLMIDPQLQANKYIKMMGKEVPEGIEVVKQSDNNLMRTLEIAIQFGKWVMIENVGLTLDPSLEPILLQQITKAGTSATIQIGDKNLSYNYSFRFFMTTTLPNPHYSPETSVKVTIINFAITPQGLQEQMLAQIVALENPNLENKKTEIVRKNAQDKKELVSIEDSILRSLSETKGDISEILMDETLINKLQNSKKFAAEINQRVKDSKITEAQIDEARESFRPVAFRAALLFFCIIDLSNIDPMYQYSLQWFINLFALGVTNATASNVPEQRLQNLNDYFTYSLYENVCRSLFERHKLLFSFMLTYRILDSQGTMNELEWRYLLTGPIGDIPLANNPTDWIAENSWPEIYRAFYGMEHELAIFKGILEDFMTNSDKFKPIFDSLTPQDIEFPEPWQERLDTFKRIIMVKALRSDKVIPAVQKWIIEKMEEKFIVPPPFDIAKCYKDSTPNTPLIFVLSPGSDPIADLMKFAEEMNMTKRVDSISLGQGQGPRAERLVKEALGKGGWVLLMNCHLAVSWMSDLEKLNEELQDQGHKDFRLWLTSMPSKSFPTIVLQNGVKMTLEPPKGLRNNLLRTYMQLDEKSFSECKKPEDYKKLLFGFSLFHAIIQERRKFGAIGWNIPYEFTNEDLAVCRRQLKSLLDDYVQIPFKVINFLGAEINYGGRVTDDKDVRLIKTILKMYICPEALRDNYVFIAQPYVQPPAGDKQIYLDCIEKLPLNPEPEAFGLHSNAEITNSQNETRVMLETLQSIQPRSSSVAGKSREETIDELATYVQGKVPELFDIDEIQVKFPTDYNESMNTVLVQELIRYNRLLEVMQITLLSVKKALKGLIVMSDDMEKVANSLYDNQVPAMWADKGFLSLKPLASWTQDLLNRVEFLNNWVKNGTPKVFWISGFFFPQAFITGMVQNFARKHVIAIDKLQFNFIMVDTTTHNEITEKPEDGCYLYGMYLEGARWDYKRHLIAQPRPKELYSDLPLLHLMPFDPSIEEISKDAKKIIQYQCPLYKVVSRAGTLSTTGHSTNFVMTLELPSKEEEEIWIRAGVAGFLALRY